MAGVLDGVLAVRFIQELVKPWEETEAFKQGIIDKEGKLLKPYNTLTTSAEKKAYGVFDRMVFNLKRLLEKVPGGKTKFARFSSALFLIKEHVTDDEFDNIVNEFEKLFELGDNQMLLEEREAEILDEGVYTLSEDVLTPDGTLAKKGERVFVVEDSKPVRKLLGHNLFAVQREKSRKTMYVTVSDITEDSAAPTNSMGGGGIQGPDKVLGGVRRGTFAGATVFDVGKDVFNRCRTGKAKFKHWKSYVGEDETGCAIKEYATKNPMRSVIIRDSSTGAMVYMRKV